MEAKVTTNEMALNVCDEKETTSELDTTIFLINYQM